MLATKNPIQEQQLGPWAAPSQFSENFQQSLALVQNNSNNNLTEGSNNDQETLSQKKNSIDLINEEFKEEQKVGYNQQQQQNKQIQNQNQQQNQILMKKGSKKKFKKKIIINTSRSRSELKLIKILCEKNNWKEVYTEGDVMWSGLDVPYEDISLASEILLNRIPGMKDLSHKKMTALFLNKFREYFPNVFDFYPRTYLFPEEYDEITQAMEKGKQVFIAKPTAGSQGDGIVLVKKMKDFPDIKYGNSKEMVVQQYLDKPLIIDNKKFDLRIFVLIASIQPFIVYLSDEGLARFCTQDYESPTPDNIKNPYIHLTNYSLNKLNPDFKYTEETTQITDGSKRTLTSMWKSIKKAGHDVEVIKQRIEEVILRFITSMHPFVLYNYQAAFQGKNTGKCFHLLGFDILLDENLKPWLIEINANPSLNIEHETDQDYKYKKLSPAIISPVDQFVKEKVMEDTLKIVTKTIDSQLLIGVGSSYGCFKQIYVNMVNEFKDMNIFKDILTVYGKVSGFKFNSTITSSKFIKLGKVTGLTTNKFTKQSYDILFTQIMRVKENCQHMDYYDFIQAIEVIAKNIEPNFDPKNKYEAVQNLLQKILLNLNQIK